jgi:hypothetical protein
MADIPPARKVKVRAGLIGTAKAAILGSITGVGVISRAPFRPERALKILIPHQFLYVILLLDYPVLK